jgi:hypothetical protein
MLAVGLKLKGKSEHMIVDAEDALIATLKAKTQHVDAQIMYVRGQIDGATPGTHLTCSRTISDWKQR